ncbi:nuclear receptor-binding factor 2-like [Pieris napi]|uniref:nuclear receptor-binding factor 2-like n=1 Tax=Pieris napi TaxID=78633 RepID=UPI001FB9C7F8|nr:nuclear receptor-binding factor 2-like [Pieris napi]
METHPLNKAHQQHRRAEALLKNNKYDDAMQCHHNAAELLLDAMKSTSSSVALESITLQHSYHLKQKDLIQSKKEQYVRVKKAMDIFKNMSKDSQINAPGEPSKVQVAIYKNLNESETLLHELSTNQDAGEIKDFAKLSEGKAEKSQKIVIEELQTLNHSLHSLVEQLVLQVEVLKDENMTLKERVNFLEKERVRYLNISQDGITLSDEPTRNN